MHHPMHCLPHVEYTVFNVSKQWQNLSFNHTYKSTAFPGLGKSSIPWCSSRKYPYLPQGRDFFWTPPPPTPLGIPIKLHFWVLQNPSPPRKFHSLLWGGVLILSGFAHCPGQVDFLSGQVTIHSYLLDGEGFRQVICEPNHQLKEETKTYSGQPKLESYLSQGRAENQGFWKPCLHWQITYSTISYQIWTCGIFSPC